MRIINDYYHTKQVSPAVFEKTTWIFCWKLAELINDDTQAILQFVGEPGEPTPSPDIRVVEERDLVYDGMEKDYQAYWTLDLMGNRVQQLATAREDLQELGEDQLRCEADIAELEEEIQELAAKLPAKEEK